MKIKETKNKGLEREYEVTVPEKDIEKKIKDKVAELSHSIKIPGFRPGKVPEKVVLQRYGKGLREEVLSQLIRDTTQKVMTEKSLRAALPPQVNKVEGEEKGDLTFSFHVETLPEIKIVDHKDLKLTRYVVEVNEDMIKETMEEIAQHRKVPTVVKTARAAKKGDQVLIDFKGMVDGKAFKGGEAKGYPLELGSGSFIPGFEDQLIGKKKGDKVDVKVTFPKEYHAEDLKGKDAVFEVEIQDLMEMKAAKIDEELSKTMGFKSLKDFEDGVKKNLGSRFEELTRSRLKREILDQLNDKISFELPPKMVAAEFESIERQMAYSEEAETGVKAADVKVDSATKKEYEELAARRVKLGLYLAEVGNKNKITVSSDEVKNAIFERASAYPGQEKEVLDFYRNTPQAVDQIRAPLFEDKVIDFLIEKIKPSEKKISAEDFAKEEEKAENEAVAKVSKKTSKSTADKSEKKDSTKPAKKATVAKGSDKKTKK